MSNADVPADWEPIVHRYVDGEWVMVYGTPDGSLVDADGNGVADNEYTAEQYVGTTIVDGERYHRHVGPSDGSTNWYDESGAPVSIDPSEGEVYAPPGTVHVHDGELYRAYPTDTGETLIVDASGAEASISIGQLTAEPDVSTFLGLATFDGRRLMVGENADGDTVLFDDHGRPLPTDDVPWRRIERVDPGELTGEPVAIGDYAMADGSVERVYLFPDGSQAVADGAGGYERVIVPTEVEYPRGRPFFEGNLDVGADGESAGSLPVFSFADGQTAYEVDGELVLMDLPLDTTHPGEAPVDCGPFPGGTLFVFPDGRQLIESPDGSWSIAQLPGLPPYEELVERYGDEVDVDEPADGSTDEPADSLLDGPLGDGPDLLDDITELPGLAGRHEPVAEDPEVGDASGAAGDEPADRPIADGSRVPDLGRPLADGPLVEAPTEQVDVAPSWDDGSIADPFDPATTDVGPDTGLDPDLGPDETGPDGGGFHDGVLD